MRRRDYQRPAHRKLGLIPPGVDLAAISGRATDVGSVEHKDAPSDAGWPRPRADASICDPKWGGRFKELTEVLRAAIRRGDVGAPWEEGLPRYVWVRLDGHAYEARLVNRAAAEYKGYRLSDEEAPRDLK